MMLLEINGNGLVFFVIGLTLLMLSPGIILIILGFFWRKKHPDRANRLWIIAFVYLLIGGGICATLLGA